ncbi:hypothetical protein [Hyalangium sp.]|uniref:hypothetical protein n=1 Tax=Hyalangium sp. TaxID=2028555 RepID=UPI002D61948C|nr:hypothetical protein [Hyalangium sp.]HYH95290.1 hypothetical protein [Hyalangium sp.]
MRKRLDQSASTLDQLAEEVGPGVCLSSDAPQQSLRQVAGELRELSAKLEERSLVEKGLRQQTQFLSGRVLELAFLLRNLVAGSTGYLEILKKTLPSELPESTGEHASEGQDVLTRAIEAAQRIRELEQDFRGVGRSLDFLIAEDSSPEASGARPDAGQAPVAAGPAALPAAPGAKLSDK